MILPRDPSFHNKMPIYIMWSPLSKTNLPGEVKHFVTLSHEAEGMILFLGRRNEFMDGHQICERNVNREIYEKNTFIL